MDAAITGSNASAVGFACDMITSFLAIGDVRDLIIQGWHYTVGDQQKYNPLTAALAGIGLAGSVTTLAAGAGTGVNTLAAAGKAVAKVLHLIGPVGRKAATVLGSNLAKIMDNPALTKNQKIQRALIFLPFFEVGAAAALIYNQDPRIFQLIAQAASSPNALENFTKLLKRYFTKLGEELAWSYPESVRHQYAYLIARLLPEVAHAISARNIESFIADMRKFIPDMDIPLNDTAKAFEQCVETFVKHMDSADNAFANVADDMLVLRAFRNIYLLNKNGDQVKKLANLKGWTIGYDGKMFDGDKLFKSIAELDIVKIKNSGTDGIQNGVKGISEHINKLNNTGKDNSINFVKGHVAMLLAIADTLKSTNMKLKGIEITDTVKVADSGAVFPVRYIDLIVEVGGRTVKIEVKNIGAGTLNDNLNKFMKPKAAKGTDADDGGQLLSDLVKYMQNGYQGRQWWFTPDVLPNARALTSPPDAGILAKREDEIIDAILEKVKRDQREIAKKYFNLNVNDIAQNERWSRLLRQLEVAMRGGDAGGEKFVKILPFSNLID